MMRNATTANPNPETTKMFFTINELPDNVRAPKGEPQPLLLRCTWGTGCRYGQNAIATIGVSNDKNTHVIYACAKCEANLREKVALRNAGR